MIIASAVNAQLLKFGQANGLFMSAAVGPRIPVTEFAETHNPGAGFDFTFSYTDNEFIPLFFFAGIGYQHFPGSQDYYKQSDHSSISTNSINAALGVRHFLPPMIEQIVIVMPVVELGGSYLYSEVYHQYKSPAGKDDRTVKKSKYGFRFGAGVSMFLLDVMGYFNYFQESQFLSIDLKIRIPIFVKF